MSATVGVVIGRFQVAQLTDAHQQLLQYVVARHPTTVVLLGVHYPTTMANPLDFQTRAGMITTAFPTAVVLPLFDQYDDESWSAEVDRLVGGAFPGRDILLYGGRQSFIPSYRGQFKTQEIGFPGVVSGTDHRNNMAAAPLDSPDFRTGVIYAVRHGGPKVTPCVDIAVLRPSTRRRVVLLGRRRGQRFWRFPGGRVDVEDVSLEAAARRELREETNLMIEGRLRYVASARVPDWRARNQPDLALTTVLFSGAYSFGEVRSSDELPELDWFELYDTLTHGLLAPEHRSLLQALQEDTSGNDEPVAIDG